MIRSLAVLFALMPLHALALCNGPSFLEELSAQDRSELSQRAAETPYGQGLYWQATKDGTTLTILGTMHLPDPRHGALLEMARPALSQADLLLVEATDEDQVAVQNFMVSDPSIMTITEGPTLPELLDAATWEAVQAAAASRGVPSFMAAKMQPWFLTLTLAMPPCAMPALMRGEGGLDALLITAAEGRMPIEALEDWRTLFDVMRAGTFEEQLDALRVNLVDPDLQDALVVAMSDGYFSGNTALIWHLTDYTQQFVPQLSAEAFAEQIAFLESELLIKRNAAWIPVINAAARRHDEIFVAFGAAHLIEDYGVLALLVDDGWAVTRLD